MLKYLIAVTNTALPTVLVMAVFVCLYEMRLRTGYKRPLWFGFFAGALAALVVVLLKKNTGFVVREHVNLAILIPTLAVEIAMIPMIWFPRREPLAGAAEIVFKAAGCLGFALWTVFFLQDILFYPYDFAVGMDNVFNTLYASKVIGYALAIIANILVFFATRSIFRQLSSRTMRGLFLLVVLVFIARQGVVVLQILVGRHIIRRTPAVTGLTIDLLNHFHWFMFSLMIVCAASAMVVFLKNRRRTFHAPNPALIRKLKAASRRQKRWCGLLVVLFAASTLLVTVGQAYESKEVTLDPPKLMEVRDGTIFLDLAVVGDGRLHRFKHYAPDGTEIRYIVIKKNETAFGVGLDACDVCGASGYYERNDQVICILCDVVMNKSTIGFPGGCNPVPLRFRIEEGFMRIVVADLEKDLWRFKE